MIGVRRPSTVHAAIELTPLIDIIFIVVVFLLLTAASPLLRIDVDLPSTDSPGQRAVAADQALTLSLRAQAPHWAMDDQRFADWPQFKPALLAAIHASAANRHVNIATDKQAPVEPLIQLLSLLNEQGMTNTHILMEAQP